MKILLVRHAEPDYAIDSLTPKGRIEAELLSLRLSKLTDVEGVYCSPLGRAQDTARYTLEKTGWTCETLPWLREFYGKAFDAEKGQPCKTWDYAPRMWQSHPLFFTRDWMKDPLYALGTVGQVWEETCQGLDAMLARHGFFREGPIYRCENNRQRTLILFCHFGIAMAMMAHLTEIPLPLLWQGMLMPPSSVTTLITEERTKGEVFFRCMGLGDIGHLDAAGEPFSTAGLYPEVYTGWDSTYPEGLEEALQAAREKTE